MDRWNIVATLNYLPAAVEAQIVLAKSGEYDNPDGKAMVDKMVKVADLSRQGFINGDISTVMSPRTVISWAQNALIFGDVGFAFRVSFLNKCDESRAAADRRILPARVRHRPAGKRGRQGLSWRRWPSGHSTSSAARLPARRGRSRAIPRSKSCSRPKSRRRRARPRACLARAGARAAAGRRGARRRRCAGAAAAPPRCQRSTRRTRPRDAEARAVFDALETARVEALGARAMARRPRQSSRARRGAGARRRDRPRAQRRGSAAGDRGRPDRARAADRRGAAARPRAPGSSWSRRGSRRRPAPSSTRWR